MGVTVSIVIVTHNNLNHTRLCLESIYTGMEEPEFEVVLVDNASHDGTPQYLKEFAESCANVKLLLNLTKEGFARGKNMGAAVATGQYLVFLNNDVVVTQGWLSGLIRYLQDPQVGMVGTLINSSSNESRIAIRYQNLVEMDQFARGHTNRHQGEGFEIEMQAFYCVAMRRAVFEEIGPLDEGFEVGMFGDDDYVMRLRQQGYKILYAGDGFIHHLNNVSSSKPAFSTYLQLFRENLKRFEQKWRIQWGLYTQRPESLPAQLHTVIDAMVWITQAADERDQTIEEVQGRVPERDHYIISIQNQLAERDQTVASLQSQAADTQRSINLLSLELNNIYQSNGWRFLQFLLRIRRWFIPEGSQREEIFRGFIRVIQEFRRANIKLLLGTLVANRRGDIAQKQKEPELTSPPVPVPIQPPPEDSIDGLNHFSWPLVSVIIPVYNHVDMLEASARSVLNSTYPNFEVIIIDDGSTDNIESVLSRLMANPRVQVYRQPNQKLPRALTHAHDFVKGEFITWTSSDNTMASQAIEIMTKVLLEHPEVVMVYADAAIMDDQGNPLLDESYRQQNLDPVRRDVIRLYKDARPLGYEVDNYINACFLYRRQVAQILEGHYADDLSGLEDYDFWLRMQKAGPILHVKNREPLYYYRVHSRTMSHELLSEGRNLHLLRGQRLIEFETRRRNYVEQRWTLSFDPAIPAGERNHLVDAATHLPVDILTPGKQSSSFALQGISKLLRFIPGEKDLIRDEPIYVKVYPNEWELIWRSPWSKESHRLKLWKGISINPLALKAREYQKNIWEFAQAGERPIIGCHLRLSDDPIDIDVTRRIIKNNPWVFFVFLNIPTASMPQNDDLDQGAILVDGLENAIYLGARPLWEPYQTYACFDLIWLPPLASAKDTNISADLQEEYIISLALACATARPLVLPDQLSQQAYPYQYFYHTRVEELDFIQSLRQIKIETDVLDRYLESWSPTSRLGQLLKYADAITQESAFARPDFGIEPAKITLPTIWTPALTRTSETIQCALVVNSLDKGGLEEIIATLAVRLPEHRVEASVLCVNEGGLIAERLKSEGIRVYTAEGQPKKIWEFLEREHPRVINSHFSDIRFLEVAKKFDIPIIETIQNTYAWFSRAGWQLEKQRSMYFSNAIAVSRFVKQYYARWNTAFDPNKIGVIPNGINAQKLIITDQNQARFELKIPQETFLFLNLASYDGRKNQLGLLTAFDQVAKKYPQAQLWCAGNVADPRYFEFISQHRENLTSKHQIQLYGFRQDTNKLLSVADAFVLDSFFEGWSLAASEAIIAGLPLIHSECGSAHELVGSAGERGVIVPNPAGDPLAQDWNLILNTIYRPQRRNTDALAEAMCKMIEEQEKWSSKRNDIRNYGLNLLNADEMVKNYFETFQSVLKNNNNA